MTTEDPKVERYVRRYGEPYRRLIEDALDFIKDKEWARPSTGFDVDKYIEGLVTDAGFRANLGVPGP